MNRAIIILFCLFCSVAAAQSDFAAPRFILPVQCTPNKNCWIVNYHDYGTAEDYHCGHRTYPKHLGTDIGIRDDQAMAAGVAVVAAAPGIVAKIRNGVLDRYWQEKFSPELRGKYCGNRVTVNHGGGWFTDYCHMKNNSIKVNVGDEVIAGQQLGEVGLSGKTEFPHLHFSVYLNNQRLDPFTGSSILNACNNTKNTLWNAKVLKQLSYKQTSIINLGFADQKTTLDAVKRGKFNGKVLSKHASILGVWALILGVNPGDELEIKLYDPEHKLIVKHKKVITKRQARRYIFAGKRRYLTPWPAGKYRGEITIKLNSSKEILTKNEYLLVK